MNYKKCGKSIQEPKGIRIYLERIEDVGISIPDYEYPIEPFCETLETLFLKNGRRYLML